MKTLLTLFGLLAMSVSVAMADQHEEKVELKPLFNGKSLDGWVQHGGVAKYEVKDGVIVGTSVPKTPNSFLCTEKKYSNFVLEVDFKVDPLLNSGIQIRSNVYDDVQTYPKMKNGEKVGEIKVAAGRVHGYQVEIDPSERAWSGGIYDEGRRGWLFDLKSKPEAQKAFKQNEWNHYRIECRGDSIKTWINGVPAADLKDDLTSEGFIALQVHGVGKHPEKVGKTIQWKNVRLAELED